MERAFSGRTATGIRRLDRRSQPWHVWTAGMAEGRRFHVVYRRCRRTDL